MTEKEYIQALYGLIGYKKEKMTDQEHINHLITGNGKLRKELEALREENEKLKTEEIRLDSIITLHKNRASNKDIEISELKEDVIMLKMKIIKAAGITIDEWDKSQALQERVKELEEGLRRMMKQTEMTTPNFELIISLLKKEKKEPKTS